MVDDETSPATGGGPVRARYDWSVDDPSFAVVETVDRLFENGPTDLEHLYDHIETDALDELFRPLAPAADVNVRVTFTYASCRVTVHGDGEVVVEPTD